MSDTSKKIVWDQTGERFYENGVDHGVLYVSNGSSGYNKGVAWNGLSGIDESPDGADANDVWADNIKYAVLRGAENFKGTIKAYTYPEEFGECDGSASAVAGVYVAQQKRKSFGFSYRTKIGSDSDTDLGYKIHVVYGASASPSSKSYETVNDSPDAIEFSWDFETVPAVFNVYTQFKPTAHIIVNSTKVDSDKLTALENKLYGTDSTDPELPSADALMTLLGVTTPSAT